MINDDEREMILELLDCLAEIVGDNPEFDDGEFRVIREVSRRGRKFAVFKDNGVAGIYQFNGIVLGGFNFSLIKEFVGRYC